MVKVITTSTLSETTMIQFRIRSPAFPIGITPTTNGSASSWPITAGMIMINVIAKFDFGVSERLDCRLRFFNRVEVDDGVGMIASSSVCLADVFDLVFVRLREHVLDFFHGGRSNPDLGSWSTPAA